MTEEIYEKRQGTFKLTDEKPLTLFGMQQLKTGDKVLNVWLSSERTSDEEDIESNKKIRTVYRNEETGEWLFIVDGNFTAEEMEDLFEQTQTDGEENEWTYELFGEQLLANEFMENETVIYCVYSDFKYEFYKINV